MLQRVSTLLALLPPTRASQTRQTHGMTDRYIYTLQEASIVLGAKPRTIKRYIKRTGFPYEYNSNGHIVTDLRLLLGEYHPRLWYRARPTGVAYAEVRNQAAVARREYTLKPLTYERDVLSLDQLQDRGVQI